MPGTGTTKRSLVASKSTGRRAPRPNRGYAARLRLRERLPGPPFTQTRGPGLTGWAQRPLGQLFGICSVPISLAGGAAIFTPSPHFDMVMATFWPATSVSTSVGSDSLSRVIE